MRSLLVAVVALFATFCSAIASEGEVVLTLRNGDQTHEFTVEDLRNLGEVRGAFERFPALEHLGCSITQDNVAAIRILQRLGFELEEEGLVRLPARASRH